MKRTVQPRPERELLATYPRRGATPGWYFRVVERSAGVWQVDGVDRYGREVSRQGEDVEMLMRDCEADAAAIAGESKP